MLSDTGTESSQTLYIFLRPESRDVIGFRKCLISRGLQSNCSAAYPGEAVAAHDVEDSAVQRDLGADQKVLDAHLPTTTLLLDDVALQERALHTQIGSQPVSSKWGWSE